MAQAERAKAKAKGVTIGLVGFEKISAIEGLHLTRGMKATFRTLKRSGASWFESAVLFVRLLSRTPDRTLRTIYRQRIWRFLQMRHNPTALRVYAIKCAVHYHMHQLVRALENRDHPLINTY